MTNGKRQVQLLLGSEVGETGVGIETRWGLSAITGKGTLVSKMLGRPGRQTHSGNAVEGQPQ